MSHECRLAEAWETDGVVVWCPCMKGIAFVRTLGPNEGTFAPCADPEVQKAHAAFIAAAPTTARQVVRLRAALLRVSTGARRFLSDPKRPTDRASVEAVVELCADIADELLADTKPKDADA